MSTLNPYGQFMGGWNGAGGVGPRGPPGENGASVSTVDAVNLTPTVVELTFNLTNGNSTDCTFGIELPTGSTGSDWYVTNLTVAGNCDLTNANVTVTQINGATYADLVSQVNSDAYAISTSINQPVKTNSDVTFNSVNVTTNVDADEINCNVLNAATINYEYNQDLLVIDKKIYVAIIPETGTTGGFTGTNSNADGGGFVVQGSNEKSLTYTSATNSMSFNNLAYVGIDGVRLYDSDSIPSSFSSGGFNVAGFGEIPQSAVLYIGDGSGYCFYMGARTGGTTTNRYCFQDNGLFTINGGKIGISNTTEFDPDYQLEIRDSSNSQIRLSTNSAAQQGNMWVNSNGLSFNTSTTHPIYMYTNSSATPTLYLDTDQRVAVNTTSPNSTAVVHVNAGSREVRIESTTSDSIVRLTNTVSGTTNASTIKQRSGATDRELQFYNQSTSLTGTTSTIYSFIGSLSTSEVLKIKNSYTNFIGQSLGVGPTDFTPGYSLEMRGAGPSIYLNGTSSGNCGIIIKTSGAASNAQFYMDSSGNAYLANFVNDVPFVFQTSTGGSSANAMRIEGGTNKPVLVGLNSYPIVGGSYTSPAGSLATSGDLCLGSLSTYRNIILNGGNSKGSFGGNYTTQGDGVYMTYNYLIQSDGTQRIINTGGETSALLTGYGLLKFKAGAINTNPSTKLYIYQNRMGFGLGDSIANSTLEVKSSSSDDILRLTSTAGNNLFNFTNSGTLQLKNPAGNVGLQTSFGGSSNEYCDLKLNGYLRTFPAGSISGTELFKVPSDSGQSVTLNGLNLHVGSGSNTDSGVEFQVTGDALVKGTLQVKNGSTLLLDVQSDGDVVLGDGSNVLLSPSNCNLGVNGTTIMGDIACKGLSVNSLAADVDVTIYKQTSGVTLFCDNSAGRVGIGNNSPAETLSVSGTVSSTGLKVSDTTLEFTLGGAPASAGATGTAGQVRFDTNYIYVCTATNTWKRAALSTW